MKININSKSLTINKLLDNIVSGYFSITKIVSNDCYQCYVCKCSGNKDDVFAAVHEDLSSKYHIIDAYFLHKKCYKEVLEHRNSIISLSS